MLRKEITEILSASKDQAGYWPEAKCIFSHRAGGSLSSGQPKGRGFPVCHRWAILL
jgi:hypothetical protein